MERYRFPEQEQKNIESSMVPFAIYQFLDKRVVTIAITAGFCRLFGYDDTAQAYCDMDNDMYRNTHPDDAARIADAALKFAVKGGKYDVVYRTRYGSGDEYKIIHAQGEHVLSETGERLAQVWYTDEGPYTEDMGSDDRLLGISLRNAIHQELFIKESYYDHLTGLPNMTYFFELASAKRTAISETGGCPALMFMDFGGMKYFNHKYGFSQGDVLLQGFSRLLAKRFGNDNCCRIGQDHFTVITDASGLENSLRELFNDVGGLNGGRSLPLHVGIYLQWTEGIAASMACDMAKSACKTIKNTHASAYSYYSLKMKDAEEKQQYIIANIDKAIAEGWITVYYQPIVRAVNGRVCNEEALARWIDPVKGFMSPGDFIPVLEDAKLIYKLDLHVVDCVLKKIKILEKTKLHLMPQSVNLSRSDFDTCDIVEEIRRRVDDAGISRSMLTIEITESVIGKDLEFIRAQTDRFRELGFAVWMDDFGSGYSSLDVLQYIKFDLLKFDMRFMQQFESSTRSRIILTEMLRMATALGIDTICEGVETEEQAQFLRETGCTKLQGYYFDKPIPVEKILEKYEKGLQIGFESPDEVSYHEAIGRVNLHDLSIIAQENPGDFDNFFDTVPMAVIEVNGGLVRFARSNQSYRAFMLRHFSFPLNDEAEPYFGRADAMASEFMRALLKSRDESGAILVDETLQNGITVHSCVRRIAVNAATGMFASVVAVLSVTSNDYSLAYANIAKALVADYFNLFYVDLESENFVEYTSRRGGSDITMERHDKDFFAKSREDAHHILYHEDVEDFVKAFTKENILSEIEKYGNFALTYRMLMDGEPIYVNMKSMRLSNDPQHLIIGVRNVDLQTKQQLMVEKINRNRSVYTRLIALSGEYYSIYMVDPETNAYTEYSAEDAYKGFGLPQKGNDIFEAAMLNCNNVIHEDDRQHFKENFTKEKILNTIRDNGIFNMTYRLIFDGNAVPVTLKATLVKEDGGEKLLIGTCKYTDHEEA